MLTSIFVSAVRGRRVDAVRVPPFVGLQQVLDKAVEEGKADKKEIGTVVLRGNSVVTIEVIG